MRFLFVSFLSFFIVLNLQGQHLHPQNYFRSPVGIPILLAGTFGELRSNHFHSGIDIKTKGVQGYKIYAVADGYVSRIKVSPFGYGNALYVTHPNGYVSVYGHLKEFNDTISKFVAKVQHQSQSFEVHEFPLPNHFPVKKGDIIAFSGNSGRSSAPHLHFEIRDETTENAINPLYFGFEVLDKIKPIVKGFSIYQNEGKSRKDFKVYGSNGNYNLGTIQPKIEGEFYVGIKVHDQQNLTKNKNGIFSIALESYENFEWKTNFSLKMDEIPFEETRYINSLIDYEYLKKHKSRIVKCHREENNKLSIYEVLIKDGLIEIPINQTKNFRIKVKDFEQNESILKFKIQYKNPSKNLKNPLDSNKTIFNCNERNIYELTQFEEDHPDIQLIFGRNCFYKDIEFQCEEIKNIYNIFSKCFEIKNENQAIHKSFQIKIKNQNIPDSLKSKTVLINRNSKNQINAILGKWKENYFLSKSRSFGKFYLSVDTIPPKISPVNISQNKIFKTSQNIQTKIQDDLSGIFSYQAFIDSTWVLSVYDGKYRLLKSEIPQNLSKGKHSFQLIVKDYLGNKTVFKRDFIIQ